ncbi:MAG TPA: cytochrome c1 [Gammaproteobacteria bacterium]|nr:cytochrome c1 [Gammaproteobacteria bacterium]
MALVLLAVLPIVTTAAVDETHLLHFDVYLDNEESLQRGAKYFVNYCSGCHSAQYVRYSRLAEDLGLTASQVEKNLIFTGQKIGDTMISAMPSKKAGKWFGKAPPDLSLVGRSRGADWLYSYLKTFYLDNTRPIGVNNLVYPDVAMPHVLGQLQGWQKPVYKKVGRDSEELVVDHLELVKPGILKPEEYDSMVSDLVNFLVYIGEPAQLIRARVGTWVMLFLIILLALTYLLKKEYWKDVH